MVDLDNKYSLEPEESLKLILDYFEKNLPFFKLIKKYNKGKFYGYGIEYQWENILVFIGGEKGGLDYKVLIDDIQISLLKYDERLKKVYTASEKNYQFFLKVLFGFLKEQTNDFKIIHS